MKTTDLLDQMNELKSYIEVLNKAKERAKKSDNIVKDELIILSEIQQVYFKKLFDLENSNIEVIEKE